MRSTTLLPAILGIFSIALIWTSYKAVLFNGVALSPQGCRMSYMWPNYILLADFNTTWSKLATRYSLWLYREGDGWDTSRELTGTPVLFLPGNAGSHHQVRSIASSAALQYFSERGGVVSPEFRTKNAKPLDVFTAKFNEDLSAFHGPTIKAQVAYIKDAIDFILSKYPPGTRIILLGHSMGGVAAVAALPNPAVSAVLTLSSPLRLAPVRYSREMETFYDSVKSKLEDPTILTPIVGICGGVTDLMIPTETCLLESSLNRATRRSIVSSALDGCWTGVGHQVSVWCHQLRWLVARVMLEMSTPEGQLSPMKVADKWLPDLPNTITIRRQLSQANHWRLTKQGEMLSIIGAALSNRTYLFPLTDQNDRLTLLFADGTSIKDLPRSKFEDIVTIGYCSGVEPDIRCSESPEIQLFRIPNPPFSTPFPLKEAGVAESDGLTVADMDLSPLKPFPPSAFLGVAVESSGTLAQSWVVGSLSSSRVLITKVSLWSLITSGVILPLPHNELRVDMHLTGLPVSSLAVYKLRFKGATTCAGARLPPVLLHHSPGERHFHFMEPNKIYLHTHSSGPFVPPISPCEAGGLNLTLFAAGCSVTGLDLELDLYASLGRVAARYFGAVASWCIAIVALISLKAWSVWVHGGPFLSIHDAMQSVFSRYLTLALLSLLPLSVLPLPEWFFLGNRGDSVYSLLGPLVLLTSCGCVWICCNIITILTQALTLIVTQPTQSQEVRTLRWGAIHILSVAVLTYLIVPYQVIFVACFILHLWTCLPPTKSDTVVTDSHNQRMHILLLLLVLLPNMAPPLAVWVRTIATTKTISLFSSDHSVIPILPILFLVESSSAGSEPLLWRPKNRIMAYAINASFGILACTSIAVGGRYPYLVYDAAMVPCVVLSFYCWIR